MQSPNPRVRATAILVEDGKILLLQQRVTESSARAWSLPGGGLDFGETLEECLIREMWEETGLTCGIERLLYVCDRIQDGRHVLHLTFLAHRLDGELELGYEPEKGANEIHAVRFVPFDDITEYGFSPKFREILLNDFPDAGSYMGSVANIGL